MCPLGDIMLVVYESGFSINEIYYNARVARWSAEKLEWYANLKDQPNLNRVQMKSHEAAKLRVEEWYLDQFVVDSIILGEKKS